MKTTILLFFLFISVNLVGQMMHYQTDIAIHDNSVDVIPYLKQGAIIGATTCTLTHFAFRKSKIKKHNKVLIAIGTSIGASLLYNQIAPSKQVSGISLIYGAVGAGLVITIPLF